MTEELQDDRIAQTVTVPYMRVTRLQEHPYESTRLYCVMQKMTDSTGAETGWKHVSKGYSHSTSAFAALGRLLQKSIEQR